MASASSHAPGGIGHDAASGRAKKRGSDAWGRRSRERFSLTREGRGYVFVTVGVGVGAVNTGNNLLYLILGLLLSLLLVSGTLSDLALYRLRVRRRVPKRLFVGRPFRVSVEVQNRKERLPSYSLELREELHDRAASGERLPTQAAREAASPIGWERAYVVYLAPGEVQRTGYTGVPRRRGRHRLPAVRVVTRYPFGLIEKVSRRGTSKEVLVYPAVHEVAAPSLPTPQGTQTPASRRRGRGEDIVGLRDARDGDALRDIHWRKSASRGVLVARERSEERDRRVVLLLDEGAPIPLPPERGPRAWWQKKHVETTEERAAAEWREQFERRVSETASLAVAALKSGSRVRVCTRSSKSPEVEGGGSPDPILAFLARLEAIPNVHSTDAPWRQAIPDGFTLEVGA